MIERGTMLIRLEICRPWILIERGGIKKKTRNFLLSPPSGPRHLGLEIRSPRITTLKQLLEVLQACPFSSMQYVVATL